MIQKELRARISSDTYLLILHHFSYRTIWGRGMKRVLAIVPCTILHTTNFGTVQVTNEDIHQNTVKI